MSKFMLKELVDLIYGTKRAICKFERENPDERVLAADGSKGIVTEGDQEIRRGANWVVSQRAVVLLTDKRIICGKWTIPLDTIASAQMIRFKSTFSRGQVLKIQTEDGKNYQFGMQYNPEWAQQQVLPLAYEDSRMKYSTFSVIVRIIAFASLILWLFELIANRL